MQYVTVTFTEDRGVIIDGIENGKTNKTLRVEEGKHVFKLVDPKDYKPRQITCVIKNRTSIKPVEIIFEKK
jgi:hypothetical protein